MIRAWVIISLAFAIAFTGFSISQVFLVSIIVSAFTVGVGFLFHELGHKFLAQKYGCWAEFRANNFMLMMALIFSFFGFIFAAPGGVFIKGHITKRKNAYISMIGPIINIGLCFGVGSCIEQVDIHDPADLQAELTAVLSVPEVPHISFRAVHLRWKKIAAEASDLHALGQSE